MYLAYGVEQAAKPWFIKQLNKSVFSFDGFCYYLSIEPESIADMLESTELMDWFRRELKLPDVCQKMDALKEDGADAVALGHYLLDLCPLTKAYDKEVFQNKMASYKAKPVHLKWKDNGDRAMAEGDYRGAIKAYNEAQVMAYSPEVANNLAMAHFFRQDYDKGEQVLRDSLKKSENSIPRKNLIKFLLQEERYVEALQELDHFRSIHIDPDIWRYYGMAYQGLDRADEALAAYIRGMDEKPDIKGLSDLVSLGVTKGYTGELEHWLVSRRVTGAHKNYVIGHLALAEGNGHEYVIKLEEALEQAYNMAWVLELADYFAEDGQIFKALDYVAKLEMSNLYREQALIIRGKIAKTAGDNRAYEQVMDSLMLSWKNEARRRVENR